MPTITATDGTEIYYKDWGTGQPVAGTRSGLTPGCIAAYQDP